VHPHDAPQQHASSAPQIRAFILGGHRAGTETVLTNANSRAIDFEYNDRGRGPKTHTVKTTDAHSVTTSLKTEGNDYFKVPVAETSANGAWSNGAENGSAPPMALWLP
jgi:hypothetical protein